MENSLNNLKKEYKNISYQISVEIENLRASKKVANENLQRLSNIALINIKNFLKNELTNIRNYIQTINENLERSNVIKSENLKETAKIAAQNLRRLVNISCLNLKETANITGQNLKLVAKKESDNLKDIANITGQNLKLVAKKESDNLKNTADAHRSNLKNKTNIAIQNIKQIAEITSDKLTEDSTKYSIDAAHSVNSSTNYLRNRGSLIKLQFQNKKQLRIIAIVSIALIGSIAAYSNSIASTESFTGIVDEGFRTKHLVQNLRGDIIDTWASWRIPADAQFHVHVLDSKFVTKDRIGALLSVIMSDQEIELDDSLTNKGPTGTKSVYYDGWYGALNSITTDTKFNIVQNLHFDVDEGESTGNIVINLTDMSSPDGYSGYTNSIVDEANHQILKSTITIYDVDKISTENLKTILRHELGHGFGLAHSTAPEELMYPVITTSYPYISECTLDAISHLYDGGDPSQVVCKK